MWCRTATSCTSDSTFKLKQYEISYCRTGGVGGSIAGFLSLAGKDVTCIARGAHLQAIQKDGLKLKSDLKGEHTLVIPTMNAEEFNGKAE